MPGNTFFRELRRRNVIKAFLSFLAISWVVLQAGALIFPLFDLPTGYQRLLFYVLLALLPIWIVFSWYYEYTSGGFQRTAESSEDTTVTEETDKRLNAVIIGGLAFAVILLIADRIFNFTKTLDDSVQFSSIAVLPFDNLSEDVKQAYFVEGMQDELIGHLAKLGSLRVISRTSTMKYQKSDMSIADIADELGVGVIVEGSVMKYGDSVRIQVQLIETKPKENHLWNNYYDRDIRNILQMHSQVTRDIAKSIQLALTPTEEKILNQKREVDPRAYEALLQGRFHMFRFTPQDVLAGLGYYKSALEIDPNYAEAYAAISAIGGFMSVLGMLPPDVAGEMSRVNVEKSLELDPNSAKAYYALAAYETWYDFDWEKADMAWQRSLELNPNDATTLIYYAHFLACMGRNEEAKKFGSKALDLDPFNAFFHGLYGVVLMLSGDYEAAQDKCHEAMERDPNNPFPLLPLSFMAQKTGNLVTAFDLQHRFFTAIGDTDIVNAMDRGNAEGGLKEGFLQAAEQLEIRWKSMYVKPENISKLYDAAGQTEKALNWLDSCYVYKDHIMAYSARIAFSDKLKSSPRYAALMEKMNFPETALIRTK